MTSKINNYRTRVSITFDGREGSVVLDQIHTIDKSRIVKKTWESRKEHHLIYSQYFRENV